MMTLSRTLMPLKIVVSWKVRTTPLRATMCGARPEMRSPLNSTSPGARRQERGDQLEQGGLAGAVRADHREDLAARDVEGDVVDGDQAAEALGQVLDLRGAPPSRRLPSARRERG